jgi:Holin of 3TMs, for gene-transfer release
MVGPILTALLGPAANAIGTIVDRLIPDKQKALEVQLEITKELMSGSLAQAAAQMEVNKVEAANASVFVSGWRPFIGWVCGIALAYQYVASPMLTYIANAFGLEIPPPPTLGENLYELVLGMLGMGAMRTFEKMKGVASTDVGKGKVE